MVPVDFPKNPNIGVVLNGYRPEAFDRRNVYRTPPLHDGVIVRAINIYSCHCIR